MMHLTSHLPAGALLSYNLRYRVSSKKRTRVLLIAAAAIVAVVVLLALHSKAAAGTASASSGGQNSVSDSETALLTFVYTNNHVDSSKAGGFNAVTGFSVDSSGALTNVGTFTTLGQASGSATFGEQSIIVCPGNRLYVTNDLDASITGFDINPATGNLTMISGSPFASGATSEVSMACTPDGKFLMVGGTNVSVLSIATNGALSAIPASPFPIDAGQVGLIKGMKVTADGHYLFVGGGNRVQPFSIAADGSLTALAMSAPGKRANGVDANRAGTHLYGGQFAVPTAVRGWSIGANADLTTMLPGGRWSGEGWYESDGKNGAIWVLLSPDERFLFGSNRDYLGVSTPYQVSVFSVNADGSLTNVTGQPPSSGIGGMGMATNAEGTLLFQASYAVVNNAFVNYVSVFNVGANGVLTHVAGSPFPTGINGALLSLAVFQPTPPQVSSIQFDAASYSVNESAGLATIDVMRTGDTSGTVTVDYATSDGPAEQRTDYALASGTITFAPGETNKTFPVLIVNDIYVEGNETVNLTLSNPMGGAVLGDIRVAELLIEDNDSDLPGANPADQSFFFVQQHYYDFLSRYPDQGGWDYWRQQITQCGGDATCLHNKRVDVSNSFFYELEFQQTGGYVYRLYREAFGNSQPFPNSDALNAVLPETLRAEARKIPGYAVFSQDRARLTGSAHLAQDQLALANAFVQRPEFLTKYPASLTLEQFVDALLAAINNDDGIDLASQRTALLNLGSRGAVVYRLADDNLQTNPINNRAFIDAEYNSSFVATQYFGYFRRDADIGGFLFWLGQVNSAPLRDVPKQHALVCSQITSAEYQQRFSSVVTHNNTECGP